ncbi:MAG TPA: hypothetical protein DDZ89_18240 [Clostridiales bacterium]|nr:hypothetical protein [Clostridiales bacterium]
MKIFGGTWLLGSEAAKQLIARGHQVTALALPPVPAGAMLPPDMKISFGNYMEMTDDEIRCKKVILRFFLLRKMLSSKNDNILNLL